MDLIKPDYFSVLTRVFAVESANVMAVSVICGFGLDSPEKLLDEEAMWEVAASALPRGSIIDHGWPKPRGEYLIAGRCYVPGGAESGAARISIRFSQLSKTAYVFGDRRWTSPLHGIKAISRPLPFKSMDLSWERAFGGEEEGENPVGVGVRPIAAKSGLEIPLPNIESPRHLIASSKDRPEPVGFGPKGLDWAVRLNNLGTFNDKWLRDHWPGVPGDFDFGYFNMAPSDQQLDGYFRGGETFNIRGMHPAQPQITGNTPKLRARVFCLRDGKNEVSEIKTSMDTVWFFPDRMIGLLIWRGRVPVGDDEAGDITRLGVFSELLGREPGSREYYLDVMTSGGIESAPEAEPEQAEVEFQAGPLPESPTADAEPDMEDNRLAEVLGPITAALTAAEEKTDILLQQLGLESKKMGSPPQTPAYLDSAKPIQSNDPEDFIKKLADRHKAIENDLNNMFRAAGFDPDTIMDEPPGMDDSSKKLDAIIKSIPDSRGELKDGLASMRDDLRKGRDKIAELFNRVEKAAPLEDFTVEGEGVDEAPEAPDSSLAREEVFKRYQQGESLANLDLSGLDLSGGILTRADLSGCNLERTNLSGADLSGAVLKNSLMADADLNSCNLSAANLSGAAAPRVNFASSDMAGSNMTGSLFGQADMTGANLNRADMTGADLSGANLKGAQGHDMIATGAIIYESCLDEGDFSGADFTSADFDSSSAAKAVFKSCRLKGVSWTGVCGHEADFENANLAGARTNGPADFSRGCFVNADLTGSYWEDSMFPGADFSRAILVGCTMTRCGLDKAVLFAADARAADFSKSDLTHVDARYLNLFEGSLRKSRLDRADFRGANLSAVDFYHCRLHETRMDRSRLNRTLLSVWRKK